MESGTHQPHALFLPYPAQGHINPMLQFAKRLSSHGLRATLVTTRFLLSTTRPELGPVALASISDGFDRGGFAEAGSGPAYQDRFESVGSTTLDDLVRSERAAGRPVRVLVYDSHLPWARDVGERHGLVTVSLFTQPCSVNIVYGLVKEGRLRMPVTEPVSLPGLPRLEPDCLPSFVVEADLAYAWCLKALLEQYKNLEKADVVFVNSSYELQPEEADYMRSIWRAKIIGPMVPSSYLDNRLPSDSHYGFDLQHSPSINLCMQWLDSGPSNSVVYVSFGTVAALDPSQMVEIAFGLLNSGKRFLWVVRSSESFKIPENMKDLPSERGLVVSWIPQMAVLSHKAVGCFLTHCGWNSTMEGITLGVPMVGVPQWTDQPMNAKYIEDVWRVGVRARANEKGLVGREEVERCVRVVMEGERSEEIRRNARKWGELAKKSVEEGGSSDRNIAEFVARYCSSK
ncbi:crocetin glucosyltransferase 2 [Elaeis guineensis]|uniref:Glycosyltransferase n=1 Tax=Elaeis guineensis var. tenera TaxID=51953 RepID=A0A6I9QHA9_ELAGV|nr:crocetin glucosyltransferase 2 [Elaeis guineensis]